jgi:hypothetical protein
MAHSLESTLSVGAFAGARRCRWSNGSGAARSGGGGVVGGGDAAANAAVDGSRGVARAECKAFDCCGHRSGCK